MWIWESGGQHGRAVSMAGTVSLAGTVSMAGMVIMADMVSTVSTLIALVPGSPVRP